MRRPSLPLPAALPSLRLVDGTGLFSPGRLAAAVLIGLAMGAPPAAAQTGTLAADCQRLDVESPPERIRRCMAAMRGGELERDFLVQAFFYGGDDRMSRRDYRLAIADYSRVLQLRPNHAEAHFRRANAHYLARDFRRALADYEKALEPNPRYYGYLVGRANARYMLHDYAGALADYTAAIELNGVDSAARVGRGNVYSVRHDYIRALADYDVAVRFPTQDGNAYYARAAARMGQRDWDNALIDLNRSIELSPHNAMAFARRARVLAARGNRDWADADFAEAERLAQGDAPGLNSLCWNLALAGADLDRARAHCDASLAIAPDDIDTLASRGLIGLRQNRFREAWADFDRALRRDRNNAELLYGRGLLALRLGRAAAGRADIARALAIEPGIAQVYLSEYGVTPDG
jgi:tetratricopeptide (TPR) repeat protein